MSELEETMAFQIRAAGLPEPVRELRFAPPRRWRFDLSWPEQKIAVEVDGGTWTTGRHTSGQGFERDAEKANQAQLMGWRVYHVTTSMIRDGRALRLVQEALQ